MDYLYLYIILSVYYLFTYFFCAGKREDGWYDEGRNFLTNWSSFCCRGFFCCGPGEGYSFNIIKLEKEQILIYKINFH